MSRIFTRLLKVISLGYLFLSTVSYTYAQSITISTIDNGPYGQGSSIMAPIIINDATGCINQGNKFELFLSNSTGSFASAVKIGEYTGHYTSYVNGVIPSGTPAGNGYRLQVRSTNPAGIVSTNSNPFEIRNVPGVVATLSSDAPVADGVFGFCKQKSLSIDFNDESTTGSNVSAEIHDENDPTKNYNLNFAGGKASFTPLFSNYNMEVTAKKSGIVGTKGYFIVNKNNAVGLSNPGGNTVCLDGVLTYGIPLESIIGNNKSNIYQISWGDGTVEKYTLCQVLNNNIFTHKYTDPSCSKGGYDVSVVSFDPFCGPSDPVDTKAIVLLKAFNSFTGPTNICSDQKLTFTNTSIPGQSKNSSLPNCEDPDVRYTWKVNGVVVAANVNRAYKLVTTLPKGNHVITLESVSPNSFCPAGPFSQNICIQDPPTAAFNLGFDNSIAQCAPFSFKPNNLSVVDNTCAASTYFWFMSPATGYVFNGGTDETSFEPRYTFTKAGEYKLKLIINTPCGPYDTNQQSIFINETPKADLSPDKELCGKGITFTFNGANGFTKTTVSGTALVKADTYTWTITSASGGTFTYLSGTNANSKEPKIIFNDFDVYTVTLTHKNNCGTVSDTQKITFLESITADAGEDVTICQNGSVQLDAEIRNPVVATDIPEWTGGTGTFTPGRFVLNPVYTPSAAENAAGKVTLTLKVTTSAATPCDIIYDDIDINIYPKNVVTAAPIDICSGQTLSFDPVSTQPGSIIRWTAVASANATGFTASGTGPITTVLTNTDLLNNATITYTFIASKDGCDGEPTDLIVTIKPNPIVQALPAMQSICSFQQTGTVITSSLPGTKYTWTSVASGGIIGNSTQATLTDATTIQDILINNNLAEGTVVYTIIPYGVNGCPGLPQTVTVKVKSNILTPLADNVISANQQICPGVAPSKLTGTPASGGGGTYDYQWQISDNNGGIWIDIPGEKGLDYQPGVLNKRTLYRRIVKSSDCFIEQEDVSNEVTISINLTPRAEFSFKTDESCAPFTIDNNNIKALNLPDRNQDYNWYADGVLIGSGLDFPGYVINNPNESVEIRLEVTSKFGCDVKVYSRIFKTTKSVEPLFTQDKFTGCGPLLVNFENTSTSLTDADFAWDYGNGVVSNKINPDAVTFQASKDGSDVVYEITLTATIGNCEAKVYKSTVTVKTNPIAAFQSDKRDGCSPLTVTFKNLSIVASTTYTYDFGDGTNPVTSSDEFVAHTFTTTAGTKIFNVKLTATNECGTDEAVIPIRVYPNTVIALLDVEGGVRTGCAPFEVTFLNSSRGATTYTYDFGDNSSPKIAFNTNKQTHTFTRPGKYTISMLAANDCSNRIVTEVIEVIAAPEIAFSINTNNGCSNLPVTFKNESKGAVSYEWNFGDGSPVSREVNPTHIYAPSIKPYSITLKAFNSLTCEAILTKNEFIRVNDTPIAAFNVNPGSEITIPDYRFSFDDKSIGNVSKWLWDFGDGKQSKDPSPQHTYTQEGSYNVKLTVTGNGGCESIMEKKVTINSVEGKLFVANAFTPSSGSPEFSTFWIKAKGIKEWRMRVFNKWGQMLWESTKIDETGSPTEGWDGNMNGIPAPQGVYVWEIKATFINGKEWEGMSYNNEKPKKTGVIHLIR